MARGLFRHKARFHSLLALLAGLLLFAQAAVVVHDLDPDSWDADHVCGTCLAASVLGGGNVASAPSVSYLPPDRTIEPASGLIPASIVLPRARARGPPATS